MNIIRGILLACAALASSAGAQLTPDARVVKVADSVRVSIEAAVDAGEIAAMDASIVLTERALAANPNDPLLLHYRAYALYRTGTAVLGRLGTGRSREYFDRARDILEPLSKRETIPETLALLASVYGMQIAAARVQMIAGMRLGPKSSDLLERAAAAGPQNPRVWLMRGIGAFNTPGAFGGGLDKAETYLKKALELFASDAPVPPLPAWGRADAHIWLGQTYAKQHKRDAARAEYEAALSLQPRNGWITAVLLPSLDKER